MRLTGLSYKTANWELNEIEFEDVSLIVGKNATGKTRTLEVLHRLYEIITQKREIRESGEWDINFLNEDYTLNYNIKTRFDNITNSVLISERMTVGQALFFERKEDVFIIKNELTKEVENGYPPPNKLVIHVARDIKKYPLIEHLVKWAEQSFGFRFGSVSPRYFLENNEFSFLSEIGHLPALLQSLTNASRHQIINDLSIIGFPVEKLEIVQSGLPIINLTEKNIGIKILAGDISQGMFRSLAILIFIEYLISKKSTATIIIDDLCEGLDYERATKLGRLLFDKCLANRIQLIATSNDMFLMDVVDLKYWNVLQRNGQVVAAINAKNHPALFEDFKFTGLSNFDFFASDYIAQNL